ncbi:hypothetical protein [Moorena sp. SIO3I6]|uniref:hypothetical protein n=1 Tax=Moorena sp. SIO3I6 TaxID=2607831 RepID=UPI0013FBBD72|nr:hypothetical protein [Moorena sp. SIO3I6]NEP21883.1 hypothetical protein [Moorena sp. SIO3I6]
MPIVMLGKTHHYLKAGNRLWNQMLRFYVSIQPSAVSRQPSAVSRQPSAYFIQ